MTAKIINGKKIAEEIKVELRKGIENLKLVGIVPSLHIVLIGENPASEIYVKMKEKVCKEVGIEFFLDKFPEDSREEDIIRFVGQLNSDKKVNSIVIQLPLPNRMNKERVIEEINPLKDVDGLVPYNLGKLILGNETFCPATPKGIITLLEKSGIGLEGKGIAIIKRSLNVGKPLLYLLMKRDATITVCHTKTRNLNEITKNSDIIICAVGKPKFLTADMIREGAVVIDVGLTYKNGRCLGDADFDSLIKKASCITPVPGGVGPMTVISLLQNVLNATKLQNGL